MTRPAHHQVLTIGDVEDLPNGTATVYRVESPDSNIRYVATIDENGFLRTLDDKRRYIPSDHEILGVY